MIKINLLPQNAQKGRGAALSPAVNQGRLIVMLTITLMVLLNGAALYGALHSVMVAKADLADVQAKHDLVNDQIQKRMNEAEQVRKYREVVTNQMDVLKSLDPPDRILWCEKLNMLSNLIPPDVFLSEIQISEQVEMIETEASKAARTKWQSAEKKIGMEPAPVKRPVISYLMKLTGLALGKDNVEQFNNVMKFHSALTIYAMPDPKGKPHRFMDGFSPNIDLGSIEATVYEGAPVNQFIFTLRTQTMGAEDTKKPAAPPQVASAAPQSSRRSRKAQTDTKL
jgi:Tfp pilus assembly protein PilN